MAKYCAKCGKQLPEGVDTCPDCAAAGNEAALFTRMTSEPETWQAPEGKSRKKTRKKLLKIKGQYIGMALGALAIVALAVFLIIFTQPTARVTRALKAGDIEKAYRIYYLKLSSEPRSDKLDQAIVAAGERVCEAFAAGELSTQETADALNLLYGFGEGTEQLLASVRARYDELNRSRSAMEEGDKLFAGGDYLSARDTYMQVLDTDSQYAEAQEKIAQCFASYSQTTIAAARGFEAENDYVSALSILAEADAQLLERDTFSADIDAETERLRAAYERYTLAEAGKLAESEEYQEAVELITDCAGLLESESEAMSAAIEKYKSLLWDKQAKDAAASAAELYAAGSYAEAFAVFDEAVAVLEETEADEEAFEKLRVEIENLETTFEQDMRKAALDAFAGDRAKLPEALKILEKALDAREIEGIEAYKQELEQYLPANLSDVTYASKDGVIFRSASVFEGLNGTNYEKGWLWGVNGASVTFELEEKYDLLTGSFACRRDDGASASGHYEIWCDGEQVYKSNTLHHYQTEPQTVNVAISGCKELKIVFICNYNASGSDNGYCYHGLCNLEAVKNIPEGVTNG